jgi:hypothetical protein
MLYEFIPVVAPAVAFGSWIMSSALRWKGLAFLLACETVGLVSTYVADAINVFPAEPLNLERGAYLASLYGATLAGALAARIRPMRSRGPVQATIDDFAEST